MIKLYEVAGKLTKRTYVNSYRKQNEMEMVWLPLSSRLSHKQNEFCGKIARLRSSSWFNYQ